MINLTPIAKPIQERMFEKMRVLGREEKYSSTNKKSEADKLLLQDIATRTTFIRMTSGQENPVVMMGGELSEDAKMRTGFKDIYTSRELSRGVGEATSFTTHYELSGPNKDKVSRLALTNASRESSGTAAKANALETFKVDVLGGSILPVYKVGRPMPGIKSIDVQFKGGVRALRTANISWTCWSFEDLDRLRTHFLSHGKTVALEWGWVYNKKQFSQLDTLIKSDGTIDEKGFEDYRGKINKAKGDFDFMVGIVKNFEYTTRDDGGFDCKTDIVTTGVSILDTSASTDATKLNLYDISEDDTNEEKIEKLEAIKNDRKELENIAFNSKLSLGIFMNRFNSWLQGHHGTVAVAPSPPKKSSSTYKEGQGLTAEANARLRIRVPEMYSTYTPPEARLAKYEELFGTIESPFSDSPPSSFDISNLGVPSRTAEMEQGGFQWILNLGEISSPFGGGRVTYYYLDADGNLVEPDLHEPAGRPAFEASKSPIVLESQEDIIIGDYDVNPKCYIIQNLLKSNITVTAWVRWGWFEDNILNKFVSFISPKAKEETAKIINEIRSVNRIINKGKYGYGAQIPTNRFESTLIRNHKLLETTDITKFILPGQFSAHNGDSESLKKLVSLVDEEKNFNKFATADKKQGYLRNILFNTNFLMDCFSFTSNNDIKTGLENLFNGMNEDINFWELTTEPDAVEPNRLKIIDEYSTYYPWDGEGGEVFDPLEKKTTINDVGEIVGKEGVFHFPVWKHNSIVKRQNFTAKVPNAMQMAAMYGANLDTMTNLMGTDENLAIHGQAAGATGKDATDVYKKGTDLAFKFEYTTKGEISLGAPEGSEARPLSIKDGTKLGIGELGFFIDEMEGIISNEIVDQVAEKSDIRIPELGEEGYEELLTYTFSSEVSDEGKLDYIEDQVRKRENWEDLKKSWWNPMKWVSYIRNKNEEEKTTYSGMLPTEQVFSNENDLKKFKKNLQNLATTGVTNIDGKIVKVKNPGDEPKLRAILNSLDKKYKINGKMRKSFRDRIAKFVTIYGSERTSTLPILIPLELQLTIDGIGGIYPGNSFHSDYIPSRYKTETMFQCFDINHTVDGSGWSVTLSGKMRASIAGLYDTVYTAEEKVGEAVQDVYDELTVPFYDPEEE